MKPLKLSAIFIMTIMTFSLSACTSSNEKTPVPTPVPTVSAFESSDSSSTSLVKPVWIYTDDFIDTDSASITVATNSVISIMKSANGDSLSGPWTISSKNSSIAKTSNGKQNDDGSYFVNPSITPVDEGTTTVILENLEAERLIKLEVAVIKIK